MSDEHRWMLFYEFFLTRGYDSDQSVMLADAEMCADGKFDAARPCPPLVGDDGPLR